MSRASSFSLVNARVVLAGTIESADVTVRDGLIHSVGTAPAASSPHVDCEGDYLLPGFVELHTDNVERHIEPRPGTFRDVGLAVLSHDSELAACGITTAFDAITLGGDVGTPARQASHLAAIESISAAEDAGLLRIDHQLHLRCEVSSPDLEKHLAAAASIRIPRLISLMDHTPGQGQWQSIARFRTHYSQRYGLSSDELDELIARRQAAHDRFAAPNRQLVLEFARHHGCIIAGHDAATRQEIVALHALDCTIAEFPTSLEAAREAHECGMSVVAGAPNLVRGSSHSGNVAAAELAAGDLIDVLSSDYCPSSLLQALFLLERDFHSSLAHAARLVTQNAAMTVGLEDRGIIAAGSRADLIRVRSTSSGSIVIGVWCAGRQVG